MNKCLTNKLRTMDFYKICFCSKVREIYKILEVRKLLVPYFILEEIQKFLWKSATFQKCQNDLLYSYVVTKKFGRKFFRAHRPHCCISCVLKMQSQEKQRKEPCEMNFLQAFHSWIMPRSAKTEFQLAFRSGMLRCI